MKWIIFSFFFAGIISVFCMGSFAETPKRMITTYSYDSTGVDTLALVGKGKKHKGKRYYQTNKKGVVVVVNPPKNNKGVWLGFLSKVINLSFRIFLHGQT